MPYALHHLLQLAHELIGDRSTYTSCHLKDVRPRYLQIDLSQRVRLAVVILPHLHLRADKTQGMVMAINILADTTRIQVAAGYESGHTMVYVQSDPGAIFQKLYCAQPHTQPGQHRYSLPGEIH